jgi:hypothetical protein
VPAGLDEVVLYTDEEIEASLRQLLRPGESFSLIQEETWWSVEVILQGETPILIWDHIGYDRRMLLLDAYGWLWSRIQPVSTSTIWNRRGEITRADVGRRATSHSPIPDPEDLDPVEVQAVYEGQHGHGKRKV